MRIIELDTYQKEKIYRIIIDMNENEYKNFQLYWLDKLNEQSKIDTEKFLKNLKDFKKKSSNSNFIMK
jgi:hypothetical protein